MKPFIAIHSTDNGPSFSTFDTIQAAKNYLQSLISNHQVDVSDTLAIVRSADDGIIYFKKRKNSIASLNAALQHHINGTTQPATSIFHALKNQLMMVFASVAN